MKPPKVKRSMLCGVIAAALVSISMAASADFSGYYAATSPNWTVNHVPDATADTGTVDTSGAPASIDIIGSDNGSGSGSRVEYTIAAQTAGNVIFDWIYGTFDDGPQYDPAGYIFGGTNLVQLTDSSGASSQGGPVSFAVSAGEIFGFYVETTDNIFGAAILTISDFCGPGEENCSSSVPEPASLALMALGLLGMGLVRRRRTR